MELLQVFEAIEKCAVQTLMVSWAFNFLFLVGDCDEWTKVHTRVNKQTWNPQTLAVFFHVFLNVSPYLLLVVFSASMRRQQNFSGSVMTTLRLTKSFTILDSALRWWTPSSGTPMWSWEDSAQGLCGKQEYRINKNEWQTYSSVLSLNFCEHRS